MTMKTLSMCRICLVENVRMYVVVNRHLQEMYEKLTNIPLVTQDSRPMLVCYFCITKLKQCCQLQRKCLEAEKMFAWMLNEDSQRKPGVMQGQLKFSSYIISPTEHISIFDECHTESDVIKTELPDDYERQDNIVELQEEHQTDQKHEFKDLEFIEIDIPAQNSELDANDDVPLFEIKIEEEQDVSKKKQKAEDMKKLEHEFQGIENIFKPTRYSESEDVPPQHSGSEDIPIQHSESDSKDDFLLVKLKTEVEEKQVSKTKNNANNTISCPVAKKPKIDVGRRNLEHTSAIQINQTEYNFSNNVIDIDKNRQRRVCIEDYNCEICQRSFGQKSHLTVHMRIHTEEKPYKCEICQRSFSVKSNLTQHIRTHTGEKPYKCELCQRSFAQSSTLLSHIRVHKLKRSKSFKCNLCKRSFVQNSHLKTHMRVHTRDNLTNVDNGKDDLHT